MSAVEKRRHSTERRGWARSNRSYRPKNYGSSHRSAGAECRCWVANGRSTTIASRHTLPGGKRLGRFRECRRWKGTFDAWAGFGRNSRSGPDGPLPTLVGDRPGQAATDGPVKIAFFIWASRNQGVVPREVFKAYREAHPEVTIEELESTNAITYPKMVAARRTTPDNPPVSCGFFNVDAKIRGDADEMWESMNSRADSQYRQRAATISSTASEQQMLLVFARETSTLPYPSL